MWLERRWIIISYLIDKFKGKYRILVEPNHTTNDWNRKLDGSLEDIDLYIACKSGIKVFYYGSSILEAYIPSKGRGRNLKKEIDKINQNLIFDYTETDSEVLFKFHYKNSNTILPLLSPRTSGAGISPYSTKNLPKSSYVIPEEDLAEYKKIVSKIQPEHVLTITHITNNFIKGLATKKNSIENIKSDMKLKCLKGKEYIHSIGKWEDYLKFLEEGVN